MTQFGFIVTRHVNSESTNRYWNQCVKLIRTFYPLREIVIIDDNSNQSFVKADFEYSNVTVVQSEFPKRGELLPFVYLLKYKWFPSAVILHDSVFIHRRVPFERFRMPVMPLWHHPYDKENLHNIVRIASSLQHNNALMSKLLYTSPVLNLSASASGSVGVGASSEEFHLCFGCQCFIKLSFLEMLERKYKISNLVHVVHNRPDRCSLERVFGLLFCHEFSKLTRLGSLFGDIMKKVDAFEYTFDRYEMDLKRHKIKHAFVKVWTGR